MLSPLRISLTLLVLLTSFVFAQADERALELLGAAEQFSAQPTPDRVRMTMKITYVEEDESFELKQHVVMDLANRRIYSEMYFDRELSMRFVYTEGEASLQTLDFGDGEIEPFPVEETEQLGEMLGKLQFDPASLYPVDYEGATYDGVKRYADLVEGEQVTVTISLPTALAPTGEPVETRFIFDKAGMIVATIQTMPDAGTLLSIIGEFTELDGHFIMSGMTIYKLTEDKATLYAKMRFSNIAFNEPVEDSLFNLETPIRAWLR